MRYFLDTEFDEDGLTITLISIALVAEDGRELYLVSRDFIPDLCQDWVKQNVLPLLPPKKHPDWQTDPHWKTRAEIKEEIVRFVGNDEHPQFWAYFADYDWVVFCQLFGRMIDLPKNYPNYCLDLKQVMVDLSIKKDELPTQKGKVHDALEDARWNLAAWKFLMTRRRHPL